MKILTNFVHPPIPLRNRDWRAVRYGFEEEGPYGWGVTESDAIEDLLMSVDLGDNVECDNCQEKVYFCNSNNRYTNAYGSGRNICQFGIRKHRVDGYDRPTHIKGIH